MSISHLTFDVYGTLFDWQESLRPVVTKFLETKPRKVEVTPFLQSWRRKQLDYTIMSTILGKGHVAFREVTRRSLLYTLHSSKIDASEDEVEELVEAWNLLNPFPDVEGVLGRLRAKYRIAMLSNGDLDMLTKLTGRIRAQFDAIISADQAGVYKPHPKIYRTAAERLGCSLSSILHVAGSSFDVLGAKSAGMRVAWVNRGGLVFEEWDQAPDLVVTGFNELLQRL